MENTDTEQWEPSEVNVVVGFFFFLKKQQKKKGWKEDTRIPHVKKPVCIHTAITWRDKWAR